MKNNLIQYFVVTMWLTLFINDNSFAVKHIVQVANFSFAPASVNVNVGDTMRWVWISGVHTTTSSTLPAGAAIWDAPITSAVQSFEYKVTVAGVHNYYCKIHPVSMIASFTATAVPPPPFITVLSPDGGEDWMQGTSQDITWSDNVSEDVKIDLYKNGSFFQAIIAATPSTGLYSWAIPGNQQTAADYKIRITSVTNNLVLDESGNNFTISQNVPAMRSLQNMTIANGQADCFDATQTISVAGGGTNVVVQNGGSVILIAGQNILMLPGTVVEPGGMMHAYITTNGQYCGSPPPAIVNATGDNNRPAGSITPLFKIYPNPASGAFNLKFIDDPGSSTGYLEIYGMSGAKILTGSLEGDGMHRISVSGMPAGIYQVRVISGNRSGTEKLILLP